MSPPAGPASGARARGAAPRAARSERACRCERGGGQLLVDAHEEAPRRGRPCPVLGGDRVRRQPRDARLDRALDAVEQRVLPRLVALGPREAALLGPATVAV